MDAAHLGLIAGKVELNQATLLDRLLRAAIPSFPNRSLRLKSNSRKVALCLRHRNHFHARVAVPSLSKADIYGQALPVPDLEAELQQFAAIAAD